MQPRAIQSPYSASDMWMAAGDLHAVKLQLSGLFVELRDKMEEEMVKFNVVRRQNDKQSNTSSIIELTRTQANFLFCEIMFIENIYSFLGDASLNGYSIDILIGIEPQLLFKIIENTSTRALQASTNLFLRS